jgi:nucleoside 2-deoxyribosyltransferase
VNRRVYLADNSRLRPDAHRQRASVEQICRLHGLMAAWPSEHALFPTGHTIVQRVAVGLLIDDPRPGRLLHGAWRFISECAALVAEITPLRCDDYHMSAVVAFEIGVAVAMEIPVFAWTADVYQGEPPGPRQCRTMRDRICAVKMSPDGNWRDDDDNLVENFGDRIGAVNMSPDGNWRDDDGNLVENFDMVDFARIAGNFVTLSGSRSRAIGSCAEYLKARVG